MGLQVSQRKSSGPELPTEKLSSKHCAGKGERVRQGSDSVHSNTCQLLTAVKSAKGYCIAKWKDYG